MRLSDRYIIGLYSIFFGVGIVLHLVPFFHFITSEITDFFLLIANGMILLILLARNKRPGFAVYLLFAYLFTYTAELAGVLTGKIFGAYQYGPTLWIQVLTIPVVIPFNWVMLVLGFTAIAGTVRIPKWAVPWLAALLLVIFDYIMEPVAMQLDYWEWNGGTVPWMNYLAWFVIALLLSSLSIIYRFNLQSRVLKAYVIIQLIFFSILNMGYRIL